MKGSLRQRSPGSWELRVDIGRDAFGKRRRKSKTVRGTKTHAQRVLREMLATLDKGMGLSAEKVLLRDWLDRWMAERITTHRRQKTKERYQDIINRHIVPLIGHINLEKLGPSHVQALESKLSSQGMSPKGVGLVHTVLSGAMKHALRMELISRNPVSLVAPPPLKRREIVPPSISVVRDALALAREEGHYLFPCIHLIAYTGLRRGEALGLTWDNVDLDQGSIAIEGSLVRSQERGLIIEPPKTDSGRRTVDLDSGTTGVLAEHWESQQHIKKTMREAYEDRGRVFAGPYGEWLNPMSLTRTVKYLGGRVGYKAMTVRSLRHFHASVTIQSGQNIVVVSKRLGHSNVSITSDIYAHSLPGWQKQAAEAFAEAMDADGIAPQNVDNADNRPHTIENRLPTN